MRQPCVQMFPKASSIVRSRASLVTKIPTLTSCSREKPLEAGQTTRSPCQASIASNVEENGDNKVLWTVRNANTRPGYLLSRIYVETRFPELQPVVWSLRPGPSLTGQQRAFARPLPLASREHNQLVLRPTLVWHTKLLMKANSSNAPSDSSSTKHVRFHQRAHVTGQPQSGEYQSVAPPACRIVFALMRRPVFSNPLCKLIRPTRGETSSSGRQQRWI